ncbi:hypothetical protein MMC21_005870 [Puttea exsequens]|nr:hypothetical protein [Puttea exsequens]
MAKLERYFLGYKPSKVDTESTSASNTAKASLSDPGSREDSILEDSSSSNNKILDETLPSVSTASHSLPTATGEASEPNASTGADSAATNGTNSSTSGDGEKLQATVTGYGVCLTPGMACGLTGSPGKDPTAAMSAYLIPSYGKGTCSSCWKLTNARTTVVHGGDTLPTIGAPQKAAKDGMVVMINNSCSPGKDQYQIGAVGQCTQKNAGDTDKLGSRTVIDLCSETDAVTMFFGTSKPGLGVADIEEVSCSDWTGHIKHTS